MVRTDVVYNVAAVGLGLFVANAMPFAEIGSNCSAMNIKAYSEIDVNTKSYVRKVHKNSSTKVMGKNQGYYLDKFYFIESRFEVSAEHESFVKEFWYAVNDLIKLKKDITDTFGNVLVSLEPFVDGDMKYLCTNIHYNEDEDFEKALDKLQLVSESWFGSTDTDISKNILIDLVV